MTTYVLCCILLPCVARKQSSLHHRQFRLSPVRHSCLAIDRLQSNGPLRLQSTSFTGALRLRSAKIAARNALNLHACFVAFPQNAGPVGAEPPSVLSPSTIKQQWRNASVVTCVRLTCHNAAKRTGIRAIYAEFQRRSPTGACAMRELDAWYVPSRSANMKIAHTYPATHLYSSAQTRPACPRQFRWRTSAA